MSVLREERRRLGRFCYASSSQYACRLEDVWLLWLAVPCVTAFKKQLPKEMSSLQALAAKCRGIMDRTAEGKIERCVQPVTQTFK